MTETQTDQTEIDECPHEALLFPSNPYGNEPVVCGDCGVEMQFDGDGVDRDLDAWSPVR